MTHTAAAYTQNSFRARNDNGSETTATWKDVLNANWSQNVDEIFRVRCEVLETAGGSSSAGKTVEYQVNGGGYAAVTASTPVQFATSGTVSDGTATTQQISSGTFVAGEFDSDGTVVNVTFAGNDRTEMEYCLTLDGTQISNTDSINVRVAGLDAWAQTPTITAIKANAGVFTTTLDDATLSADAGVIAGADASITLEDFTVSATTAPTSVNADGAFTCDDATISATASTIVSAEASISLDDAGLSSSASLLVQADLSITLEDFTVQATVPDVIAIDVLGDINPYGETRAYSSLYESSDGYIAIASMALADATLSSDASLAAQADLSVQLDDSTINSSASLLAQADGVVVLDEITVSSGAALAANAEFSISLDDAQVSSGASLLAQADLAVTLDDASLVANAAFGAAEFNSDITLADASLSSTASLDVVADAFIQLADAGLTSTVGLLAGADTSMQLDDAMMSSSVGLLVSATANFSYDDFSVGCELELSYVGNWFGLAEAGNEWSNIDDPGSTIWYLHTQAVEIPTYGMAESYGDTAYSTISDLETERNAAVPTPFTPATTWENL